MQVYFFTAGVESNELRDLEHRIRAQLSNLRKIAMLDEVSTLLTQKDQNSNHDQIFILFPVLAAEAIDRIVKIAERDHPGVFFIFISREISASDYKRLVRSGGADWVSVQGAPQEIMEIISRASRTEIGPVRDQHTRPALVAFLPTGGGVGNATLAIETAVQIKLHPQTGERRVCLLDLDLQGSHVGDYLDIEPRLQMQEIIENPERLDAQLFDLFVSRHSASGVDVLATPRSRGPARELNMAALDALFRLIASRYDLVLIDLPPAWFDWTDQVVSACDLTIIVGFNNVSGLRRIAEVLQQVRAAERSATKVMVALNRCEYGMGGRIARQQHVKRALGNQAVIYIREDAFTANHSINTGVPISITSGSSKIAKDIRSLTSQVSELAPVRAQVPHSSNRLVGGLAAD